MDHRGPFVESAALSSRKAGQPQPRGGAVTGGLLPSRTPGQAATAIKMSENPAGMNPAEEMGPQWFRGSVSFDQHRPHRGASHLPQR